MIQSCIIIYISFLLKENYVEKAGRKYINLLTVVISDDGIMDNLNFV